MGKYGTTASKKSRYTNKMTKYKSITNGKQLKRNTKINFV